MNVPTRLLQHFLFPAFVSFAVLLYVGASFGTAALMAMLTLTLLEITFSLDNAVINATVLRRMSRFWQHMFLTLGIIIAVFGMRLLFPLVLVAATAGLGLGDVAMLALQQPADYALRLQQAEPIIAAFGGMFLLMIFIGFLFDEDRGSPWQHLLHRALKRVSTLRFTEILAALIVLLGIVALTPPSLRLVVALAGLMGVAVHLVVSTVADLFNARELKHLHKTKMPWHVGLTTFLYLELLDASISFDAVIGAFAITTNVLLIAAGLGLGALWMRSITVYLVRQGTLAHYKYLDAGAHVAVGSLAVLLLVGIHIVELPDALSGVIGLLIITTSFVASLWESRRSKGGGSGA